MRESKYEENKIEFRAWDREKERMLPVTSMDWSAWWVSCEPILEGEVPPLEYGERNSFANEPADRHILMQYTGFKDREKIKIFESDVLASGIFPRMIVVRVNAGLKGMYLDKKGKKRYKEITAAFAKHVSVVGHIFER